MKNKTPKGPRITLTAQQYQELVWLRGGIHVIHQLKPHFEGPGGAA